MAGPQRSNLARKSHALRLAAARVDVRREDRRRVPPQLDEQIDEQILDATGALAPDIVEVRVRLDGELGLIEARRQSRQLAARGGFRVTDRAIVAAIVSELGRNILLYAAHGEITVRLVEENERVGILISACDTGPGIPDLSRALRDGYSTSGRLGMGLPGVRRLADEFDIACGQPRGTNVTVRKWRN